MFQQIRDEIDARRKQGQVVVHVAEIHRALGHVPPTEQETKAVDAVVEQLAKQGVIARSRVSTGEAALVLQLEQIERYAGSLIVAARNNPRGVPALELRAVAQPDFVFQGMVERDRLSRERERPVLECTLQLLLEHGICLQHEGLLIFPTLFAPAPETAVIALPHSVSLYYDFAGAIDNVYASLVAWLVLAQNFGRVRLWPGRAEFEVADRGLCGLRKVARPGGFALHLSDLHFNSATPVPARLQWLLDDLKQEGGLGFNELDYLVISGLAISLTEAAVKVSKKPTNSFPALRRNLGCRRNGAFSCLGTTT